MPGLIGSRGWLRFPHPEPDQNPLFMSGEPACGKCTLVKLIRTMIGSENLAMVGGRSGKGIVLACLSQRTLLVNFAEFEFDGWARHKGLKFILNEQAHRVLRGAGASPSTSSMSSSIPAAGMIAVPHVGQSTLSFSAS